MSEAEAEAAPTSHEVPLIFAKAAKGSGGDKYKAVLDALADTEKARFIYIPQEVSRKTGTGPIPTLTMTISYDISSDGVLFTLLKEAKGSGDNRYTTSDAKWGDMYLPKGLPHNININISTGSGYSE